MAAYYSGCQLPSTMAQAVSLDQTKPTGAQALAKSPTGLAAPLVSSFPSRAKIPVCDGWGPRAPPSIPSSFPGPRAGPGSSLEPLLPGPPSGWAGRALLDRQPACMLHCCGLSTLLSRAVCQGLQVPARIPAPSQGASKKQA